MNKFKDIAFVVTFLATVVGFGIKAGVLSEKVKNIDSRVVVLEDNINSKIDTLTNSVNSLTIQVAVLTERVTELKGK